MWLNSLMNYRLHGAKEYLDQPVFPLIHALDNFSSPIQVIITNMDQSEAAKV